VVFCPLPDGRGSTHLFADDIAALKGANPVFVMHDCSGHESWDDNGMTHDPIVGCMLGTAIGDAIGLPYEGLSPERALRLLGTPDRHRLVFGRGMVSDDTEHTCIVAQSLITAPNDPTSFQRSLAWRLRVWLLGIPAGIGFATLRAILRLWIGISPARSGVFSAGNGPAMRAAILGAAIDDPHALRDLIRVSSRMTHSDPKAESGAFAVALAAQMARQESIVSSKAFLDRLASELTGDANELLALLQQAAASINAGHSTEVFAQSLGLTAGVTGYVYHTVPVALHAWLSHPHDFRAAIMAIIRCGGDTDSTAAIVGGIVGTSVGREGIPREWLDGLIEWPRSVSWMERLGVQLSISVQSHSAVSPIRVPASGLFIRNLLFLIVVLCHGFRRLAPPY
jgi:ADP-ribosyl-[dinitrogen reductase] hydrolase